MSEPTSAADTAQVDAGQSDAVQADPALAALANAHPELDAIRWRVTLADGSRGFIRGDRIEHPDPGTLLFLDDDGTTQEFAPGEWRSLLAMPGKPAPTLDAIAYRLLIFGLIDNRTYLNRGGWLQAQPEWIAAERAALADDPKTLAVMEDIHRLRQMGL